ncbi:uncharacterized protein LOC132939230 [Metopolophium dirhodum]|uniref:uncharacterized protein LOC132939230 n=1 Tax=Metopolophium dirhodum TaxID=44670 RepID=UPI0029908343|nr:uncharacterized protein LOC132939230 [Metopolophium dirhodum]
MSEDFVTFNIRCEKALFELKIKSPIDVSGFVKKLKNELKLDESDDLVILCPVSDGNMMEIQSDDDIEFLKNTKLTYNAENKDFYCNVELAVIIIHKLPDDPKIKFKVLSNKLNQLASQVDELSNVFKKMITENESSVISTIFRSILAENSEIDFGNKSMIKNLGKPSELNLSNLEPSNKQKKTKKDKEELSSTFTLETNDVKSHPPCFKTLEDWIWMYTACVLYLKILIFYLKFYYLKDIPTLYRVQTIIVLKRFNNNYNNYK